MMAETSTEETSETEEDETPPEREPAIRLFAAEFNDAQHETQGEGERAPSYVVTPLGARVNRTFVVGVLTANEPTGEDDSMQRAQITDPTGVFHVYAGRYEPEALEALRELEPPQIVGVVGKARTYEPEEGTVYTSIRPEEVHPMKSEDRDAWILETAEHTVARVEAMQLGHLLEEEVSVDRLVEEGVNEKGADGIMDALSFYGQVDLPSYLSLVADALGYLLPAPPTPEIVHAGEGEDEEEVPAEQMPSTAQEQDGPEHTSREDAQPAEEGTESPSRAAAANEPGPTDPSLDPEAIVFDLVEELDDGKGAPWEQIVDQAQAEGLSEEEVEETMNQLMDRGRVFEPVLGKLKAT